MAAIKYRIHIWMVILLCVALGPELRAQALYLDKETGERADPRRLLLPYFFATEDLGIALGVAYSASATVQEQAFTFATGYASDNGSWLLTLVGKDWRVPGTERLFVEPFILAAEWAQLRVYSGYNVDYPGEVPGSNDSSQDNYQQERAYELWTYLDLSYVLPFGGARDHVIPRYTMDRGLPASGVVGATSWNPRRSGISRIAFRPEYRRQFVDDADYGGGTDLDVVAATLNYRISVEHDNRDFPPNPTRGTYMQLRFTHDPGWLSEAPDEWMSAEADLAVYIPLPTPPAARQSTLALNMWTVDTPSWQEEDGELRLLVDGAPPYFRGASLGGLFHMKAYPTGRFNSRASMYYGAEYRFMPDWQPLPQIRQLGILKIRWWQLVLLAEVGRVADTYDVQELHTDMKWDVGAGINVMFGSGVARVNITLGEEGSQILAMVGQSY